MIAYIEKKAPKDKEWFKSVAMVNGKYSHLKAVKAFAERYFPDIIPTKKRNSNKIRCIKQLVNKGGLNLWIYLQ